MSTSSLSSCLPAFMQLSNQLWCPLQLEVSFWVSGAKKYICSTTADGRNLEPNRSIGICTGLSICPHCASLVEVSFGLLTSILRPILFLTLLLLGFQFSSSLCPTSKLQNLKFTHKFRNKNFGLLKKKGYSSSHNMIA